MVSSCIIDTCRIASLYLNYSRSSTRKNGRLIDSVGCCLISDIEKKMILGSTTTFRVSFRFGAQTNLLT